MENDDIMPNEGSHFGGVPIEPTEQAIERKKQRAKTLEALQPLKEHIERLQERIEFYEKNSSVNDVVRVTKQEFMIVHNTYSLMAKTLRSEKEYLEGLIDTYAKNL